MSAPSITQAASTRRPARTATALPAPGRAPVLGPTGALVLANIRYWTRIAPLVRRELQRWTERAALIPDRAVRELARGKLRGEHFNAEVAATLATLAPKAQRLRTVEAIVAFEVLYDYLDGVTERLEEGVLERGAWLYRPFIAAFGAAAQEGVADDAGEGPGLGAPAFEDGGYAEELAATVREALASLPSRGTVLPVAERAARRCAEAQVRVHAAPQIGTEELERWARARDSTEEGLDWRAYVAGSVASVLSVHALIAAAAQQSLTEAEAATIDRAYLLISALSTMLDSLVDYERDVRSGEPWLAQLYGGPAQLGARLDVVARRAVALVQLLPRPAHHAMTLLGVVAYYTSAPEGKNELARPVFVRLHRELRPVILPTLAVMRTWRLAKALRGRWMRSRRERARAR